jgi:hypothetical protein
MTVILHVGLWKTEIKLKRFKISANSSEFHKFKEIFVLVEMSLRMFKIWHFNKPR